MSIKNLTIKRKNELDAFMQKAREMQKDPGFRKFIKAFSAYHVGKSLH